MGSALLVNLQRPIDLRQEAWQGIRGDDLSENPVVSQFGGGSG